MGGDRPEEYMRFAGALGAPNMIGGWEDVCERSEHFEDERAGQGTSNYARLPGNSMHSLTLECGHHNDPQAPEVGYRAVLNTLRTLGMADIAGDLGGAEGEENRSRLIRLESVQFKTRDGDLTRDWVNMDPVREGEGIAVFSDGEELRACRDGFVVMPHRSLDINAEWFFFGVEEDG